MHWLTAYPIASISTALFYLFLLSLAWPRTRAVIAPLFVHPVLPHQKYQRGFDTIRGFAACWVALAHFWWASHPLFHKTQIDAPFLAFGTKAVSIFAVLSGFLIYRSVAGIASIDDLRAYAIRRFFRIYPVYLLGVVLALAFGQYVTAEHYTGFAHFVADVFMLRILEWPSEYGNPPTWSLYIEMAFYAFLPLVMVIVRPKRMLALALIGIIVMVMADVPSRIFVLWRYFLFGIAASELSPKLERAALPVFCLGVALLAVDISGYDWVARLKLGLHQEDYQTVGLGISSALILASLPHLDRTASALNILPLRMIGVISYSVYIIQFFYIAANFREVGLFSQLGSTAMYQHFLAMEQFPAWYLPIVFFPGILFWGAVSFLLVEKPGMRLGRKLIDRLTDQTQATPFAKPLKGSDPTHKSAADRPGVKDIAAKLRATV